LLAAQSGLGGAARGVAPAAAVAADQELAAKLFAAGSSRGSFRRANPRLVVSGELTRHRARQGGRSVRWPKRARQIVDLNLQTAGLPTDDGLAALGDLGAVTELRLSRNKITDRGVGTLARAAGSSRR